MSIRDLKKLVTPPPQPFEVGSSDQWRTAEQELGVTLPSDYREFVFSYGSGLFAQFYRIYNPFSASQWTNLRASVERVCAAEREIKQKWPTHVPYKIYPDTPGLLPWGNDENGNDYFWLTDGPPDGWLVVSDEVRGEGFREYGRTMTDFLCDVLTGKIGDLAGEYPSTEYRVFEPWTKDDMS